MPRMPVCEKPLQYRGNSFRSIQLKLKKCFCIRKEETEPHLPSSTVSA